MAYKVEYVIDSCLVSSHPLWYKSHWISEVVKNIKLVNEVVSDALGRKKINVTMYKVAKTSMNLAPSLSAHTPRANEEMECFHEAMDKIKEQLLGGSSQLDIISIVGMPGIGKTTLAEKIYNDLIVTPHFDVHAKCHVTQVYSWIELLLTILNDVLDLADHTEKEDGELANELRQVLLTKRFLILVDDVWDKTAWDHLYMCFRDAQSRSRIIQTTRLSNISNYVKSDCGSNPFHLRLLTDDESWILLQEEVFQRESYPPELVDIGYRIAKRCEGLPIFIVLVAGVLKKKKKKADLWEEAEQSLGSQNIGSLEKSMFLIEFSYKNLPHHMKPCFLYFGGFFKGRDTRVSKLARLSLVEGFVQANKERRREDVTQVLLEDLITINLVMVMEKRPNDKGEKMGEDMLPENPGDYQLFIHSYQDEIDLWRPCRSNVRSLQFKGTDPDNLLWPRDISFIFDSFKVVKVLDLESFNIGGTFPREIQSLICLRYFAIQTDSNSIPSFIAKLWNLETFVVRRLGGELVSSSYSAKLPHEFSFPTKLRELTLSKFRLPWSEISIIGELHNLEILMLLSRAFEGNQCEVNVSEFPELKYLNLDNIDISQWSVSDDSFPKLECLVLTKCKQLEEIPSHFVDAISLKRIEVNRCGWFVANSALEFQPTQHEEMANDAFTVKIQPPD
ncbi:hypothetical protein RND71_023117 [Anisodus tanguticus]|uniref:NB-ARC domain-containing protein n=1 Tax=Anisodus tanguticus TaxID=243964 RepID=A0AAE1RU71_9SOLA|nr:hypothetical protein RND71_023117 [Anisodus tanguticus]